MPISYNAIACDRRKNRNPDGIPKKWAWGMRPPGQDRFASYRFSCRGYASLRIARVSWSSRMGLSFLLPSHRVQWRDARLVRSRIHRMTLSCLASGSPPWPKILSSDRLRRQGIFEIRIVTPSHHPLVTDNPEPVHASRVWEKFLSARVLGVWSRVTTIS